MVAGSLKKTSNVPSNKGLGIITTGYRELCKDFN